jgi:membrane fusion protein, multidrug efflux system
MKTLHKIAVLVVGAVGLTGITSAIFITAEAESATDGLPATRPVKTIVVGGAGVNAPRQFPGRVQATQEIDLSFRVTGPLHQFPVKEGQLVRKGEIIAALDPRDFEIRLAGVSSSLLEARAQLKAMRNGARPEDITMIERQLASAKAQLRQAQSNHERAKELYVQDAISSEELERYRTGYDVAQAQVDITGQDLGKARTGARLEDVEAMEARVAGLESQERNASSALNDTRLRAPFTGVVAARYIENYQWVKGGERVVRFHDVAQIEIQIDVPESEISRLNSAAPADLTVTLDALPGQQFRASVKEARLEADAQTRTYPVTLTMALPAGVRVLPGMTATLTWGSADHATVGDSNSSIPADAVFADEAGHQYVWLVNTDSMTVCRRRIVTGGLTGNDIEVVSGLEAGATIVTAGVHFLVEGQAVRQLERKAGA